jgi:hypothetical protein
MELFARGSRKKWYSWGDEATDDYRPTWDTYAYNSRMGPVAFARKPKSNATGVSPTATSS